MIPDTPMFRQFSDLKAQVPDCLLFFRNGDFYELFGDDAVWAAQALELTLTARDKAGPNPTPMAGVPHHAAEGYIRRLLELGRKVAIADQVEDPRFAKGLVKREVVRIHTPGLSGDTAEAHEPNWLVAVMGGPGRYGLALLDASTGDARVTEVDTLDQLLAELGRHEPKEALLGPDADDPEVRAALPGVCVSACATPAPDPRHADLPVREAGRDAVTVLLAYAEAHLKRALANVSEVRVYTVGGVLGLDEATRRNLELFRPLRGAGRKGTLLHLLDGCRTAMGGRLLREWMGAPLLDPAAIEARLDAVAALVGDPDARKRAIDALAEVADMERIAGRVSQGTATPRDLAALRASLERLPALKEAAAHPALAGRLGDDLAVDVAADIATWLVDEPPATQGEGGLIRPGADAELDRLRSLSMDAKGAIAAMEAELRDKTGIGSLKIRFNSVFGYYIEVTKANLDRVPARWHRKQTISTGERYITPELKEYEEAVLGADERRIDLELARFQELRQRVSTHVSRINRLARGVAELDVLATFADLAVRNRYTRPVLDVSPVLEIEAGRHPVVESAYTEERFVPNDLRLDPRGRFVILTGPNMAGKSTLMRQVALTVLLAQMGAYVPATRAKVGICDRIFVRVGASDDLARGASTFMVEMSETANILASASPRSLVLLDEIGRGTSTYDGLAIAWAVAEDLHDRVKCRAVFATHYHELAALNESCGHVRNLHVAATEHGDRVVFLRKVKEGPAPGSYGIQCARLAGLPQGVVGRAGQLLKQLEQRRPRPEATQMSLFGGAPEPVRDTPPPAPLEDPVRAAVEALDPDQMSPKEALAALYRLKELAGA